MIPRPRDLVVVLAAFLASALIARALEPQDAAMRPLPPAGHRYALLIGCTRYPGLRTPERSYDLVGPRNDALLLEKLLTERYGFRPGDVVKLIEGLGPQLGPTRANIERELKRLASKARTGDFVVITYSGHGSQQPDQIPPDPVDPEPDGMDEILLPSDASRPSVGGTAVPNALVDDDFHKLLEAIMKTGARTCVVIDACHSGTSTRADVVTRNVPPDDFFSEEILADARRRAGAARALVPAGEERSFEMPEQGGDLVVVYAALPTEVTVEMRMPPDLISGRGETYGLLSYTINQVLTNARSPLTYRDLIDRVYAQYNAWGRTSPTPLVEGRSRDTQVLGGGTAGPPSILLMLDAGTGMRINAGAIHGLTEGTVLAVRPPAGTGDAGRVIGHVRVAPGGLGVLESRVEPCADPNSRGRAVEPTAFLPASRCTPEVIDLGDQKLRVALETPGAAAGTLETPFARSLAAAAAEPTALFHLVRDASTGRPAWVVRLKANQAELARVQDATAPGAAAPEQFGPVAATEEEAAVVADWLNRIARVEALKRLAASFQKGGSASGSGLGLEARMLVMNNPADPGKPLGDGARGLPVIRDGQLFACELANRGMASIDVSVLFLSSDYGIDLSYPEPGVVLDNRLPPVRGESKPLRTPSEEITAETVGVERLLVVAVASRGRGQPVDFSALQQPGIRSERRSAGARFVGDQLRELIPDGLRGARRLDLEKIEFRIFTWRTEARDAGALISADLVS